MKRVLAALACAMSLTGIAMGQNGPSFGSRTSGLGNAGGFATGSGFSNGSAGSSNFGWSTGAAFGSAGGFSNGSNAAYNFGGPAVPTFITGSSYWGSNNVGTPNLANPATPGLGLGDTAPGTQHFRSSAARYWPKPTIASNALRSNTAQRRGHSTFPGQSWRLPASDTQQRGHSTLSYAATGTQHFVMAKVVGC